MFIKSINFNLFKRILFFLFIVCISLIIILFSIFSNKLNKSNLSLLSSVDDSNLLIDASFVENSINNISDNNTVSVDDKSSTSNSYIKWVDFNCTANLLTKLADLDIYSHNNNSPIKYNWIELMAYLGCKSGGNLSNYNISDLSSLLNRLDSGESMSSISKDMKLYNYFYEAYDAIFHGFIGDYEIQSSVKNSSDVSYVKKYGLKAFSPIANGYYFNHYKDFGSSRSYGYKRVHLGNDLLGSIRYSYNCC